MARRCRPQGSPGAVAALLVLLAALAAACSPGAGLFGFGGSGLPPPAAGVLRLGLERPASLDPAQASPGSQAELIVADLLFDGLVDSPGPGRVEPELASGWDVSDDQRTFTFELRDDATFSDGTPVTADDVRFTIERVVAQGSESPVAAALAPVAGFGALSDGSSDTLAGLEAPDDRTVVVTLDEPFAELPDVLASPVLGVVPRAAVTADPEAWAQQPVGSGPLAIADRSGRVLRLQPAAGADLSVGEVDVVEYDGRDAAYDGFVRGQVDWAQVGSERLVDAVARYGDGILTPSMAEVFYGFNLAADRFDDVRFREAIVAAVDRESILADVYGPGMAPMTGVVPLGLPGSEDDPCGGSCAYDPDRAQALLAEAFPDGGIPEVPIDYEDEPAQEAVAGAIADDLRAVGITAVLQPHPAKEYAEFLDSGEAGLFRLGWIGAYPSAEAYLEPLFSSSSADDVLSFSSASVDDGLARARATADPAMRAGVYSAVEREVMAVFPVLPLGQFLLAGVASSRVSGLTVAIDGTFDMAAVVVAPPAER